MRTYFYCLVISAISGLWLVSAMVSRLQTITLG